MLAIGFALIFTSSYRATEAERFLSLDKLEGSSSATCESVLNRVSDTYYLDDTGFWSTSAAWAFSKTMLAVNFRAFGQTAFEYQTSTTPALFNTLASWNEAYKDMPVAKTLVDLVVRHSSVTTEGGNATGIFLETDVSPGTLMNLDNVYGTILFDDDDNANLDSIEIDGDYIYISMQVMQAGTAVPNWQLEDSEFTDDVGTTAEFKINKFSLFVAAAVNMGLLSVNGDEPKLTNLKDTSDLSVYGVGDDDFFFGDDMYSAYNYFYYNYYDYYDYSYVRRLSEQKQDSRSDIFTAGGAHTKRHARRTTEAEWDGESSPYPATDPVAEYVLRKFYDRMDPIVCAKPEGDTETAMCWIRVNGDVGDDTGGAFYPKIMFSRSEPLCNEPCADNSLTEDDIATCSDNNLEYALFFDYDTPSNLAFIPEENHEQTDGNLFYADHGVAGLAQLRFTTYGGANYMNELYYKLPDKYHCSEVIALASNGATVDENGDAKDSYSRDLNCVMQGAGLNETEKSNKYDIRFCNAPPVELEQIFYKCAYTVTACLTSSLSEAYSFQATLNSVFAVVLIALIFALKRAHHFTDEKKDVEMEELGITAQDTDALKFRKIAADLHDMHERVRKLEGPSVGGTSHEVQQATVQQAGL